MREEVIWDLQFASHELVALGYELILSPMLVRGTYGLMSFKRFSEIRSESPEYGLVE